MASDKITPTSVAVGNFDKGNHVLVDILEPIRTEKISIENIAHSLSGINRYTGSSRINVCFHSLHVHAIVQLIQNNRKEHGLVTETDDRLVQLYALLHDAHEMVIGDVSTPFKRALAMMSNGKNVFDAVDGMWIRKFARDYGYHSILGNADVKFADETSGKIEMLELGIIDSIRLDEELYSYGETGMIFLQNVKPSYHAERFVQIFEELMEDFPDAA